MGSGVVSKRPVGCRAQIRAPYVYESADRINITAAVMADGDPLSACAGDPGELDPAPTATCDDGSQQTMLRQTMLAHTAFGDSWCEGTYAIVDADYGAGACTVGEWPNPCAGQQVARMFLRAVGGSWRVMYQHPYGGCGDIVWYRSDFPTAMCADLAPLPGASIYGW